MRAHNCAVKAAMSRLQEVAGRARIGAGGSDGLQRVDLIAAFYDHKTSREADPQVHTHVAIAPSAQ